MTVGAASSPDFKLETIRHALLVTDARSSTKAYFSEKADEALVRIEKDLGLFSEIALASGGVEVRDRGDGTMFAFCDPVQAVSAALAMQTEVARRNSGLPSSSLVVQHRMGLHIGEIKIATTYFRVEGRETARRKLSGDIVVAASRLEAICHPGEICFSNDVYRLVRQKSTMNFALSMQR